MACPCMYISVLIAVLFGRGRPYQLHPGNIRFQKLLSVHRENYLNCKRQQKQTIIKTIVYMVKHMSGRFLKQAGPEQDYWVEQSDEAAMDKVSHALRSKYYQERDESKPSATTEAPVVPSASLAPVNQQQQMPLQPQSQGLGIPFPIPSVAIAPTTTTTSGIGAFPLVPIASLPYIQLHNQPRSNLPLMTVSQLLAARSLGMDLAQTQNHASVDPVLLSLLARIPGVPKSDHPP